MSSKVDFENPFISKDENKFINPYECKLYIIT